MARQPKRACSYPGCPNITTAKHGYCPRHKQATDKDYEKTRETATQRGYTKRAWQSLRTIVLNNNPLCKDPHTVHKRYGEIIPATEVDHIDGNRENNLMENLQPLCKQCHSRKTAAEHQWGKNKVYTAPYSK
jgi:5-methylcytosine-specific restriction protein A